MTVYRELAKARPDAFLPALARALGVLGLVQRGRGQFGLSVNAHAEGLRLVVPLFMQNQRAFVSLTVAMVTELDATCRDASLQIPEDLQPFVEAILAALSRTE